MPLNWISIPILSASHFEIPSHKIFKLIKFDYSIWYHGIILINVWKIIKLLEFFHTDDCCIWMYRYYWLCNCMKLNRNTFQLQILLPLFVEWVHFHVKNEQIKWIFLFWIVLTCVSGHIHTNISIRNTLTIQFFFSFEL